MCTEEVLMGFLGSFSGKLPIPEAGTAELCPLRGVIPWGLITLSRDLEVVA